MNLFVTGTDTGCGKTYVSAALVAAIATSGRRVLGMKPIASGAADTPAGLRNDDVEALRAASNVEVPRELVNSYLFRPPCSPHIAAAEAGVVIDLARIRAAYEACTQRADCVIVEGVGGWMVPLGPDLGVADLARALDLPIVLVVGIRLGCINHALLTAAAITASGLPWQGWIANVLEPGLYAREAVVATLDAGLPVPRLATLEIGCNGDLTAYAATLAAS